MNYTKREVAQKIKEYVNSTCTRPDVGTDPDQRDYEVDYSRATSASAPKSTWTRASGNSSRSSA